VNRNMPVSPDGRWIVPHDGRQSQFAPPASVDSGGAGLDFSAVLRALVHWRWLIGGPTVAGLILGIVATMLTTPMYRSTVTLEVNPPTVEVVDEKNSPRSGSGRNFDVVATQVGLIGSRAVAERAAQELSLANNKAFVGEGGTATERLRRATDLIASSIKVKAPEEGNLIEFSYSSSSPQLAAAVANQIADSFIGSGLQRRYEASSFARNFLNRQIVKTRGDLEKSERQLVAYAQSEGIINTGGGKEGQSTGDVNSLQGESLVALNSALGNATAKRMEAESAYRQGTAVGATTDVTASTAGLRASRAALQAEYQQKRTLMKPDHPDMLSLQSQINELDHQIARESSQVSSSRSNTLLADYRSAAAAERSLQGKVAALKGSVLNLRGRSIEYNILQRDVDTNRSLYDALLQRYKEVGVAAGVGESPVSIVDHAQVPGGPYRPNLLLNVLIGFLVGLIAGIAAAVGLDVFFDTIKTREDVRYKLKLACLGAIPKIAAKDQFSESLKDPGSQVSEAYSSVIASLRFSTEEGLPRTFMISSTRASEGKSSSSLAVSQILARLGNRVLLIDGDLRKPIFKTADENIGLTYLLTGESQNVGEHISATQFENLHLLPAGPTPPNPADLLSSGRFQSLLTELETAYDSVVIDAPPVMGLADSVLLASISNNVLFVVESGQTRTRNALEAVGLLRNTGAQILGAVLTKATGDLGGYGYYGYKYKPESIGKRTSREIKMFPSAEELDA
jgi:succinoglycan biosynthesis transport protein ExoP